MTAENIIFHIATDHDVADLERLGQYRCASLDTEGFIHCCNRQQLAGVVSRYYQNTDHLKLLVINPDKLESAVIYENTVGGSELFAHVYGPLDATAICNTLDFGLNSAERLALNQ